MASGIRLESTPELAPSTSRCCLKTSNPCRVAVFIMVTSIAVLANTPQSGFSAGPRPRPFPDAKPPILDSYPQAKETIYLNFCGALSRKLYPYSGARVHGKDDNPFSFNKQEKEDIKILWRSLAENFSPFAVNVTTDARRYDYAVENNIPRTIVYLSPSHRGASWSASWFFKPGGGMCSVAMGKKHTQTLHGASHELGHSMGLDHDNTASVIVSGTNIKAGNMFNGGGGTLIQWCKNEGILTDYSRRQREPLTIISSQRNGIGYRTDDHGNEPQTATLLIPGTTSPAGIIERNTDVDVFRFSTVGGPFEISVRPHEFRPVMLDVLAELYDSKGKRVMVADPKRDISATLKADRLAAGTYYLHVSGTGRGTPGLDGYSDYGSLGTYHISAKYTPTGQATQTGSRAHNVQATTIRWPVASSGRRPLHVSYNGQEPIDDPRQDGRQLEWECPKRDQKQQRDNLSGGRTSANSSHRCHVV